MSHPPQHPQDPQAPWQQGLPDPAAQQQAHAQQTGAYEPMQPGYPQAQAGYPPAQQAYPQAQQGYPPAQQGTPYGAARPKHNPFAGTPVSDWVRDGAAVVLLLASLALPWSLSFEFSFDGSGVAIAATRVEVLLITLLSALSVSIGYLARAGVFGPAFSAPRAALVRALLNLPYLLLVLLYVVFDAVRLGDLGTGVGLGAAAAVGLTGAILAAVPRRYEVHTAEFAATAARHGHRFVVGFFIIASAATLLGIVLSLVTALRNITGSSAFVLLLTILLSLAYTLTPLLLVLFVLRRSESARVLSLAFGVAMIVGTFITVFASQSLPESLWSDYGYPALLIGALAGVMSHAGLPYAMRQQPPLEAWHAALKLAALVAIIVFAYLTVNLVISIVVLQGKNIGYAIGILVCVVLSLVAALVLRMQLITSFQHGRTIAAGIAGGIAVLGLVAVVLAGLHNSRPFDPSSLDFSDFQLDNLGSIISSMMSVMTIAAFMLTSIFTAFFAPAGLILYGLFVPAEVRGYYAAAARQQAQYQQQAQYPQQVQYPQQAQYPQQSQQAQTAAPPMPQQAQAAAQPQVDPELARRAIDAATSPQEQFELAQRPELWPYLAQNPALYDDLAQWLAQVGDPQVQQILRSRGK